MSGRKIIVVKKKKKGHEGHHGGSWKVAYADFVTAMMAFFLVMWIMGMDQGVRDLVQGYFENPVGFKRSYSGGQNILSQGNSITNLELRGQLILKRREAELTRFREVEAELERELAEHALDTSIQAGIEVVITRDGLRVEMMEPHEGEAFFESGSETPTPALLAVLHVVAQELTALSNGVVIEGHTDASPFGRPGYTNWDLSTDRANAARRVLLDAGLDPDRLTEVRGYADRQLKFEGDPLDHRNRRVSILLPFDTPSGLELDPEDPEVAAWDASDRPSSGDSDDGEAP